MKEARTLLPPWGGRNFSRIVWRGRRSRSPGSVSSKPISTKFMGSCWGVVGMGVVREEPGIDEPRGTGVVVFDDVGIVVVGVDGGGIAAAGVSCVEGTGVIGATGVEGAGIRVTGVVTAGRIGFGSGGIGLRFPDGGGIRVTGVAMRRGTTGDGTGA